MKTVKVMSIIGIVWFVACLLFIIVEQSSALEVANQTYNFDLIDDVNGTAGWGFLALLYAIPLAIVGIVQGSKKAEK